MRLRGQSLDEMCHSASDPRDSAPLSQSHSVSLCLVTLFVLSSRSFPPSLPLRVDLPFTPLMLHPTHHVYHVWSISHSLSSLPSSVFLFQFFPSKSPIGSHPLNLSPSDTSLGLSSCTLAIVHCANSFLPRSFYFLWLPYGHPPQIYANMAGRNSHHGLINYPPWSSLRVPFLYTIDILMQFGRLPVFEWRNPSQSIHSAGLILARRVSRSVVYDAHDTIPLQLYWESRHKTAGQSFINWGFMASQFESSWCFCL